MLNEWLGDVSLGLVALCCVGQLGGCIFGVEEVNMAPSDLGLSSSPDAGESLDMELGADEDGADDQGPSEPSPDMTAPCDAASSQRCCADQSIDLSSDPEHCGACEHACGAGQACVAGACICADGAAGQPIAFELTTQDEVLFVPYMGGESGIVSDDPNAHAYTLASYIPGEKTLRLVALDGRGVPLANSEAVLDLVGSNQLKRLHQVVLYPLVGGGLQIGAWISGESQDELYLFKAVKRADDSKFELVGAGDLLIADQQIVALGVNKPNPDGMALLYISSADSSKGHGKDLILNGELVGPGLGRLEPMDIDEKYAPVGAELQVTLSRGSLNVSWLSQDKGKMSDDGDHTYQRVIYVQESGGEYRSIDKKLKSYDSLWWSEHSKSQPLWPLSERKPDEWLYLHSRGERGGRDHNTSLSLWRDNDASVQLLSEPYELLGQDYVLDGSRHGGMLVWLEAARAGGAVELLHAHLDGAQPTILSAKPLSQSQTRYDEVFASPGVSQTMGFIGSKRSAQALELDFFMSVGGQAVCAPSTWRQPD